MPLAKVSALDIVAVSVAAYAAVVGTIALAFQIFSWLRSWQTRLEVKLRLRPPRQIRP